VNQLLQTIGPNQLVAFALVLARLVPMFLFAPMFSSRLVPVRVRGIVAVALAIGLSPLALGNEQPPLDALSILGLMVKEMLVGLAFAFAIGMVITALQVAGSFLDALIGFAFGAMVDPVTGNQGTVLGQLYGLVGVLIFIAIGGDQIVIRGFAETYELVGLLEAPEMSALLDGALAAFAGLFLSALQVAAPVVLALILTDVAFGLVTRVVPQLNVFAVGLPAKVIVGLVLVGASLPFVGGFVSRELEASVSTALGSLGVS
jgi:flagellar biosynthetic protein FliR